MEILALVFFVLFWSLFINWVHQLTLLHKVRKTKELWKTYALSLEVALECVDELEVEIPGEGCRTRSRRREPILIQQSNARISALRALDTLMTTGEYV